VRWAALVVALASCEAPPAECPGVGCFDQVSVLLDAPPVGATVTVCKNAACTTWTATTQVATEPKGAVYVEVFTMTKSVSISVQGTRSSSGEPVDDLADGDVIEVRVVDGTGVTILDVTKTVTYATSASADPPCGGGGCRSATIDARM
jgi:hypothetical protein